MKRSIFNKRFIVFLLAVCLTVSLLAANSYSDDAADHERDPYSGEGAFAEQTEQTYPAPQPDDLTGLRYIDLETLEKQGAIKRLPEKETLNTYAFLNRDGTESVVMFPDNIKYIDGSGAAVEKDITLIEAKSGGYTVKANDCDLLLPEDIKDGLSFSYSGGSIKLTPEGAKGSAAVKEESSVSYYGVFGEHTVLRYTPLLNGVKEDIVLYEYTGLSSFGFDLTTDKLWISDKEDRFVFVNENGEPAIEFGDVFAYDASGKTVKGSLLVERTEEGKNYSVTVTVPEKFLTDPETVYPVTVDPTVHESNDGSAIQDSSVYLMIPDTNYGSVEFTNIGYTGIGPSNTAVWLKGLDEHSIYRTLDAEEIVSVTLKYKTKNQTDPAFVNLYRISENVSWTESTVTYNNVGTYDTADNEGEVVYSGTCTEFDITSFAKGWKNCSYNNTMRVIFVNSSDYPLLIKQFDSSECAVPNNRPCVVFTYQLKNRLEEGVYYIRNRHIDKYLQPTNGSSLIGTGMELNAFSGYSIQKWVVFSLGNGFYTIKNVSSGYVLSVPSGAYSTYDVQLTQTADTQADGQLWRIYMTSYCGFAIKPKSACGPGDGTGWSDRTMSVADGNDGNGALVTQRPYVYNNSYKDEWYLVPTDVPGTGDLPITNRQLGTNVQPYGGIVYSNNSVVLWEQTSNNAQKWNFTSVGDGYYKITPKIYPSYALSIASGSETAENGAVRFETYSSGNTRQQWFIYKVPGGYVLKARSCGINNLVLSVSEGNLGNGAVVSQRAYVNNLSYKEEWFVDKKYYVQSDGFVAINQSITLSVQGANTNSVLWSSYNPNIASVNGSGVVTGLSLGRTVITATFIDQINSSLVILSSFIDVILQDGVYSIKNSNSYKLLDSVFISTAESLELRQYQLRYGENAIKQMWRITHVSRGQYRISSYYCNNVFVGTEERKVVLTHNLSANTLWQLEPKDGCMAIKNATTNEYVKIENDSVANNAYVIADSSGYSASGTWILERYTVGPNGILFFDDEGFILYSPIVQDVFPGQTKSLEDMGITVSAYSFSNSNQSVNWSSSSMFQLFVTTDGSVTALQSGSYVVTATMVVDNVDYSNCYEVKVGYSFGITVQNTYPTSCEMRNGNYASFGLYVNKLMNGLTSIHTNLFCYAGNASDANDLKNKNLPGATHTFPNMDDVDLMIYTGHGYAKNRNEEEGLFLYNSLHFGSNTGQASHDFGVGNTTEANYTTLDAYNLGNGTRTKWFLAYTCNFLNTAQGDTNVYNILSNGGRLVMGLGSKSYIVANEGSDFADYLNRGYTIADAFFQAGHDNQEGPFNNRSKKLYRVLYFGPEDGGTLNDTLIWPLTDVPYDRTIIKDVIINSFWGTDFQCY